MSASAFHVLIIGADLGGLCLAQGLQRAGVSVAVYERDATPLIRRQGYRIHLDARGANGLRACLPPHLFDLYTATTAQPGQQLTVLNSRLKPLRVVAVAPTDAPQPSASAGVDRLTLREILLSGLDSAVSFGKEFTRYAQLQDGSVQATFADGATARGDLLVAADGVNSRVRQQFLPDAAVTDTGARCIYGRVSLTNATRPLLPASLHLGFTVVAHARLSMALGLVEFCHPPNEAAAQYVPGLRLHTSGDYLMWSLNGRRGQFAASDEDLLRMDGPALRQLVLRQIKDWHPDLRALIAASDPDEIFPLAVRVSVPHAPWQSVPITLLGDAIHAMSPAGGSGANMALLDAGSLCTTLTAVASGEAQLLPALHDYEARMLKDGFEAVRFSARGGVLSANTAAPKPSWLRSAFRALHRP